MSAKTDYQTLIVDVDPDAPIMRVTINRPKVLNALNLQVITELEEALEAAIKHKLRVLVIEGAGDKAFVAGADIAQMLDLSSDDALRFARQGQRLTQALEEAPLITIAKVQGYALGGGCELAMACDLLIAAESSIFGQPEVDLGLIPGFGGTQRLVKRVGLPLASAILYGGRKLTGRDAFHCGLVSDVAPKEELETSIQSLIKAVLKAGPQAIVETKRLARMALDIPLNNGLAAEATAFANCFARPESREGIQAFLEKRAARFSE
ncbi:MAG: enoyl-CoA hydratase/isomerase family protein [Oligoflexus sp.]